MSTAVAFLARAPLRRLLMERIGERTGGSQLRLAVIPKSVKNSRNSEARWLKRNGSTMQTAPREYVKRKNLTAECAEDAEK